MAATEAYRSELASWRLRRGLSKNRLAGLMAYDRTYVVHVENGNLAPTEAFTAQAEQVLGCGGALRERFEAWRQMRATGTAYDARTSRQAGLAEQIAALSAQVAELTAVVKVLAGERAGLGLVSDVEGVAA